MNTNAIARRYAKALIGLAAEEGAVERFYEELAGFSSVLGGHRQLKAILTSPAYTIVTKKGILRELVDKLALSATVADFLFLLLEKDRLRDLPAITCGYRILADDLSGILRPTVTSALPLDESQVEEIRATIERSTGKRILLQVEHDPSLIGGVVTKIGDKVFDGAIKTQLQKIQDILQKG